MAKRWILGLLVAAMVPFVAVAQGQNGDEPVLRAVTDPSFPPFEMKNRETGEMVGFDMDILQEVADRAGFDYKLRLLRFPGIIPALQTGTAQIAIAGIYITDKRDKVVDFSNPYYHSGMKLLVPADSKIQTLEDLDGKRVGTKTGSTSYAFLKKRVGDVAEIVPFPTTANMYMAVTRGTVDAVLYDLPNVQYFVSTKENANVKIVGPLYEGAYNGLAFPEGSPWVDDVNQALASIKEDGTYAEIYEKWFGEPPSNVWRAPTNGK